MSASRVAKGTRSSATSDVFIIFSHFWHTSDWLFAKVIPLVSQAIHFTAKGMACMTMIPIGYLQTDPCSHYFRNLSSCGIFRLTHSKFQGSTQILSRRQHAPNEWCPLNNDVRLINRLCGTVPQSKGAKLAILETLSCIA